MGYIERHLAETDIRKTAALEGVGNTMLFVGVLGVVAVIASTFEFGRWTVVCTYAALITVGLLGLGYLLSDAGYRWHRRIQRQQGWVE